MRVLPVLRPVLRRTLLILVGAALLLVGGGYAVLHVLDRSSGTILSSGQERAYLLHVPASYDGHTPVPLVISLHGAALWPALQMWISGWSRLSDTRGFLVVYPAASGFPRIWHVDRVPGLTTDVRFIADLIDALEARYAIDPARVYVNGMSNGGGMAFVLSCTLSDRIAAIGMVAAAQSLPWDWCTDRRPLPMISFHGTADPIIPFDGGPSPVGPAAVFPSVPGWAQNWAQRNGCAAQPLASTVATDVVRTAYGNCTSGADVTLYAIGGGGHTWPGGASLPQMIVGPTSRAVDATQIMWDFFRAHRLGPDARSPP